MKIHWPLLAASSLALLSTPALAQTLERPPAVEPPPVEPLPQGKDSEDGGAQVKIANLSLTLGGYIQPGFVSQVDTPFNEDDSHDGFEFANARLTAKGKQELNEHFFMGMEFGFDVATGNFDPKDVYGTLGLNSKLVMLDVGQMKQPFGLAQMQSEAQLQFPLAARVRELAFGRDQGARLRGEVDVDPVWIGWGAMIANGEGGFRARRNIDDKFTYSGRLEVSLHEPLKSESDLWDSELQLTAGGSIGYTPELGKGFGIDDVGLAETRYGADFRAVFHGATARAEYIGAKRDGRDGGKAVKRQGIAVQAGYVLPLPFMRPQLEPVVRMEISDVNQSEDGFPAGQDAVVDNTERRTLEFGANVYIEEHRAKLQIAYRLTDLLEGPKTDSDGNPLIGDEVFVFMQFGWF
ncbi:MAG: hypothetical protein H6718_33155 [Polyangiaceae bacterium]|nr:hypothetical protein [Myxococcales bacterium]MCB9590306.1 hypothetical protein [Polyangiaceae bacterium]MCB9605039.1 hypothetical protein [Polyangiaceae bacterium]